MDRLLNVVTVFSMAADSGGAGFGAPRAYSRGVFGELAGGGVGAAGAVAMAGTLRWIGGDLGVADAPVALLVVAGALFLLVLFRLSLRISGLKDANIALTQRLAILEFRLETIDEEVKTSPAG